MPSNGAASRRARPSCTAVPATGTSTRATSHLRSITRSRPATSATRAAGCGRSPVQGRERAGRRRAGVARPLQPRAAVVPARARADRRDRAPGRRRPEPPGALGGHGRAPPRRRARGREPPPRLRSPRCAPWWEAAARRDHGRRRHSGVRADVGGRLLATGELPAARRRAPPARGAGRCLRAARGGRPAWRRRRSECPGALPVPARTARGGGTATGNMRPCSRPAPARGWSTSPASRAMPPPPLSMRCRRWSGHTASASRPRRRTARTR